MDTITIDFPNLDIEEAKDESKTIKKDIILFVCTGNTCRSPMCAALFNFKYADDKRFAISAGLSADGSPISSNAKYALKKRGIMSTAQNNYDAHISRTVNEEMMDMATKVVGVSDRHAMSLMFAFPKYASKITSFSKAISDPYMGNEERYIHCLSDIEAAIDEMFGIDNSDTGNENGNE